LTTVGILAAGMIAMRQGNQRRSQMLMRYRIGAQAATFGVLGLSALYVDPIRNGITTWDEVRSGKFDPTGQKSE